MGKITENERIQFGNIIEEAGLYRLKSVEEFDTYLDNSMDGFAQSPLFAHLSGGNFTPQIVKSTMGLSLRAIFEQSITYADSPELNACAVWIPSGINFSSYTSYIKELNTILPLIGGISGAKRIIDYILAVNGMKRNITNHNDWYLYNYECSPSVNNDELITKMLKPFVSYAWSAGRTCYLESSIESRMPSLMKMGFHIVDQITVSGTHIKIYGMMV